MGYIEITELTSPLKIGKVSSGEYVELDEYGVRLIGNASQYEDLQVTLNNMGDTNPNPPIWRKLTDQPNSSTTRFLSFNNQEYEDTWAELTKTTNNNLYSLTDWSLSVWIKPEKRGSGILELANNISLDVTYNDELRFKWGSEDYEIILPSVVYGTWYHIIVTNDNLNTRSRVKVYVNNRRKLSARYNSILSNSYSEAWVFGARGQNSSPWWNGDLSIEELILYNFVVSSDQRNELWNVGDGTDSLVTGATSDNVMMWLHFNGTTETIVNDALGEPDGLIIGTHYTWVDGGVGEGNNALTGVRTYYFEEGMEQQLEFSTQVLHGLYPGSGLPFHMHVVLPSDPTSNPVFGIEYSLINIDEQITTTNIIYSNSLHFCTANNHGIILFPEILTTNGGNTITMSAMFHGRLFRTNDYYEDGVFFKQIDCHIKKEKLGSFSQWSDSSNE